MSISISVVMPAYNAEGVIERALKSIFIQTQKPLEIIVVDDGSSDGTADVVRDLAKGAPVPVHLITQENGGAAAARNVGIASAKGSHIAFLDADDEWLPEKLAICMKEMRKNGLKLISHSYQREGKDVDCADRYLRFEESPLKGCYMGNFIATSTVIAEKDLLLKAGLFNAAYKSAHDHDLWLRCLALIDANDMKTLPDVLSIYHIVPGSISSRVFRRFRVGLRVAMAHSGKVGPVAFVKRIAVLFYELWGNLT